MSDFHPRLQMCEEGFCTVNIPNIYSNIPFSSSQGGLGATAAPMGAEGIAQSAKLQNHPIFGCVGGWRCNSQRMQLGYFHARRLLAHH